MSKSHADFYASYNISPVHQDISDINRHFQRRDSLYRSLGIVPNFVSGLSFLEFGPGSGHNALYTANLLPSCYELVDGNPRGVAETRERLKSFPNETIKVHYSKFEDFNSEKKFDIVWAEGCLPLQNQPISLLNHISTFVKDGGVLCVSINNGISYLSEIFRRLLRDRCFEASGDVHYQVTQLLPIYKSHLQNLRGMSRSYEDWIMDSIVHPLADRKLMSIPEVINSLHEKYDVYCSSPRFLKDWRWYKEVIGDARNFNSIALNDYYQNNLNLIDYRFQFPIHSEDFGKELEEIGSKAWDIMCRIENGEENAWQEFYLLMQYLIAHIENLAPETGIAISEAVSMLQEANPYMYVEHFPRWWGRGQQYLSLIKK